MEAQAQYYALVDGKELGPFSLKAIRLLIQGADRHVLVRVGASGWIAPDEMDWEALENSVPAPPMPEPATPIEAPQNDPAATLVFKTGRRKKKSNVWPFAILLFFFAMAGVFVWGKVENDAKIAAERQHQSATISEDPGERQERVADQRATGGTCEEFWSGAFLTVPQSGGCRDFYNKTRGVISAYCRQIDQIRMVRENVHPAAAGHYDEQIAITENKIGNMVDNYLTVAHVNNCG